MKSNVILEYHGIIKYETIGELIHKLKQRVAATGLTLGVYKRVLLIMIESLENIMKHSYELPHEIPGEHLPILSIEKTESGILIKSSNPIGIDDIQSLQKRIERLNVLDAQSLKNVYKETITDGVFTKTGGAGLGLIEIIKISGHPIKYTFITSGEHFAVYKQEVFVKA